MATTPKGLGGYHPSKFRAELGAKGYASTPDAARCCGMAAVTVARWVDGGEVRGLRTPTGRRYVFAADLLTKLGENLALALGVRARLAALGVNLAAAAPP
jgi:hypothetical protein